MTTKMKTIGIEDCLVGLEWYALEVGDREEITMLRAESGASFGALTYSFDDKKRPVGVGFLEVSEDKTPDRPSAAAMVAGLVKADTLVAEVTGDKVWLVAVQGGVVVPGTDAIFSSAGADEQIAALQERDDFLLVGTFFEGRQAVENGAEVKVRSFSELVNGAKTKKFIPRGVRGGLHNYSVFYKAAFVFLLITGGGWYAADEYYFGPIQMAEEKAAADLANEQKARASLAAAENGDKPLDFHFKVQATLNSVPQLTSKGWGMNTAKCAAQKNGCDLYFQTVNAFGGSLVDAADVLGVQPTELKHGLAGSEFGFHVGFVKDHTPHASVVKEYADRAKREKGILFSDKASQTGIPGGDTFLPFFIDKTNDLTKMSGGTVTFVINESKSPVGIAYDKLDPELFYKKGTWEATSDLWSFSEAVYWLDRLGVFITHIEMEVTGDKATMGGYYLVK